MLKFNIVDGHHFSCIQKYFITIFFGNCVAMQSWQHKGWEAEEQEGRVSVLRELGARTAVRGANETIVKEIVGRLWGTGRFSFGWSLLQQCLPCSTHCTPLLERVRKEHTVTKICKNHWVCLYQSSDTAIKLQGFKCSLFHFFRLNIFLGKFFYGQRPTCSVVQPKESLVHGVSPGPRAWQTGDSLS